LFLSKKQKGSNLSRLSLLTGSLGHLLSCGGAIRCISCSPCEESNLLLTAASDKLVCLWNVSSGNLIDTLQMPANPFCVDWVSDDDLMFAVGQRNMVQFFDGRKEKKRKESDLWS
jgi:WD40 repeat protein